MFNDFGNLQDVRVVSLSVVESLSLSKDCVVFGRVAGKAACKYTFGTNEKFKPCPTPGE